MRFGEHRLLEGRLRQLKLARSPLPVAFFNQRIRPARLRRPDHKTGDQRSAADQQARLQFCAHGCLYFKAPLP